MHFSPRKFPDYYYELNFRISNMTLTIIMLDTVKLCGRCDDFLGEMPSGPLSPLEANRQLTWLRERLARSRADFLLVAGHYPVWSVSEHGPTRCLLRDLLPLLKKYKATAYFCGHDHNLQVGCIFCLFGFLAPCEAKCCEKLLQSCFCSAQYIEESNVGYVVSGAGNFIDPDTSHWDHVPKGAVKFFTGQASTLGGFVHVEVTKDEMVVKFLQAKGTSLYRTVLSRRNF